MGKTIPLRSRVATFSEIGHQHRLVLYVFPWKTSAAFYCVMFIYAVVGIYFFNGLITRATMLQTDTDYMYMMMNYNDLWGALCVLI